MWKLWMSTQVTTFNWERKRKNHHKIIYSFVTLSAKEKTITSFWQINYSFDSSMAWNPGLLGTLQPKGIGSFHFENLPLWNTQELKPRYEQKTNEVICKLQSNRYSIIMLKNETYPHNETKVWAKNKSEIKCQRPHQQTFQKLCCSQSTCYCNPYVFPKNPQVGIRGPGYKH